MYKVLGPCKIWRKQLKHAREAALQLPDKWVLVCTQPRLMNFYNHLCHLGSSHGPYIYMGGFLSQQFIPAPRHEIHITGSLWRDASCYQWIYCQKASSTVSWTYIKAFSDLGHGVTDESWLWMAFIKMTIIVTITTKRGIRNGMLCGCRHCRQCGMQREQYFKRNSWKESCC